MTPTAGTDAAFQRHGTSPAKHYSKFPAGVECLLLARLGSAGRLPGGSAY